MNQEPALPVASELMRSDIVTLDPSTEVADAVKTLLRKRQSGAPVVEAGKPVGMFSERDALTTLAAAAYDEEPSGLVGEHMRKQFQSVEPGCDLFALADLFRDNPVRRLPVVGPDDRLLGIVLRGDVLRALAELQRQRRRQRQPAKTPYERIAEQLGRP